MYKKIIFYLKEKFESALSFFFVRFLFFTACVFLSALFIIIRNKYLFARFALKCDKILSEYPPFKLYRFFSCYLTKFCKKNSSAILTGFLRSTKSKKIKREFYGYGLYYSARLKYPKENDEINRQGDLIVLKPFVSANEKGVLLIKYNDSFLKFLSVFDINKICRRYRIVLEPSTWGYQDVVFWLYDSLDTDVVVQCQDIKDYYYIKSNTSLYPIRIGAGDWFDPAVFSCDEINKKYDIIMVASWQLLKRHRLFFRELSKIKEKVRHVCLVGYPCGGRTKEDVLADARRYGVDSLLDIFENISPEEVARKICLSKISVMLSKREGASKVIYESLACNVPVVLSDQNRGVNREIINQKTGILSSDEDLSLNLLKMVDSYRKFSPRKWLIENSGYFHSTKALNSFISHIAINHGEKWTKNIFTKSNMPNPLYVFDAEREVAEVEYKRLECLLA